RPDDAGVLSLPRPLQSPPASANSDKERRAIRIILLPSPNPNCGIWRRERGMRFPGLRFRLPQKYGTLEPARCLAARRFAYLHRKLPLAASLHRNDRSWFWRRRGRKCAFSSPARLVPRRIRNAVGRPGKRAEATNHAQRRDNDG